MRGPGGGSALTRGRRPESARGLRGRARRPAAIAAARYALDERLAVDVGKTPHVRFDLNDCTVPHTHVRRTLSVLADDRRVRVLDASRAGFTRAQPWRRPAVRPALFATQCRLRASLACARGRASRVLDRLRQSSISIGNYRKSSIAQCSTARSFGRPSFPRHKRGLLW